MSTCKTANLFHLRTKITALEVQLIQQKFQRFSTSFIPRRCGVVSSVSPLSGTQDFTCIVTGLARQPCQQSHFWSRQNRVFPALNFPREEQARRCRSTFVNFHISKVLVVSKTTRYMFEQQRENRFRVEPDKQNVSEEDLKQKV